MSPIALYRWGDGVTIHSFIPQIAAEQPKYDRHYSQTSPILQRAHKLVEQC